MSSFSNECYKNGCVCAKCIYRQSYKNKRPKECHGGGCCDCVPEYIGHDDPDEMLYGPEKNCPCNGPYLNVK
ncbi:MAG: hypothetical protein K0R00_58 [Herbinix sp.]|nr:hypothetical protein [Herbinix sp.]